MGGDKRNQDTPEDGLEDSHALSPGKEREQPESGKSPEKSNFVKEGEELSDALKRALHLGDKVLLKEILGKDTKLATYKIDASKNVQVIHKAAQSDDSGLI